MYCQWLCCIHIARCKITYFFPPETVTRSAAGIFFSRVKNRVRRIGVPALRASASFARRRRWPGSVRPDAECRRYWCPEFRLPIPSVAEHRFSGWRLTTKTPPIVASHTSKKLFFEKNILSPICYILACKKYTPTWDIPQKLFAQDIRG